MRFHTERPFAFLSRLWGLGATSNDHLRRTGKRVVDFVLTLIVLFSLCVTAEALRANIGSKSAISLQRGRLTQNYRYKGSLPPIVIFPLRKLG